MALTNNPVVLGGGSAEANTSAIITTAGGVVIQQPGASTGLQIYNTADQTTNYERMEALWSSNIAILRTAQGGTGTLRTLRIGEPTANNMVLVAAGSTSGQIQFNNPATALAGNIGCLFETGTWSQTSGTNAFMSLTPVYNQASGTAANTDLLINRTQTTVGSGAQNLIDAQVSSASVFKVSNVGLMTLTSPSATSFINLNASGSNNGVIGYQGNDRFYVSAFQTSLVYPNPQASLSGTFTALSITPAYNQASGTAANTDLLVNRTQTAVGSGTQLLLDLQVATVSKFNVTNTGQVSTGNILMNGSFFNNSAQLLWGFSSANLTIANKISSYNALATAGWGVPAIQNAGRITAQSGAATIGTYTPGAADGSFRVSANMNVTASTTLVTTITCAYTDESNTARVLVMPVAPLSGTWATAGAITGAGASVWHSAAMHIRCKASTAITVATTAGTFTGVTYTAECSIQQIA